MKFKDGCREIKKYRRRPEEAVQFFYEDPVWPDVVELRNGDDVPSVMSDYSKQYVHNGDYIIQDGYGDYLVKDKCDFERDYEEVV